MNNHSIESHFTMYHNASFYHNAVINYNQENISRSKKKNSKYKTGIDYNEENNSMQGTKEVCCF